MKLGQAAAQLLLLACPPAMAHPGHGAAEVHLHGFSPEMILLVVLVGAWAILRSGK